MRLIDADKFDRALEVCGMPKDGETCSEWLNRMRSVLYNQPIIFPMYANGICVGKQAFTNYVNMCKILDEYGLDSMHPVKSLNSVLSTYQKVLCNCTTMLSKLTYDADTVIAHICDKITKDEDADAPKPACYKCIHHTIDSCVLYCHISHESARQRLFEDSCDCFEPESMYKDEFTTDKET